MGVSAAALIGIQQDRLRPVYKLIALLLIFAAMMGVAFAQQNAPFRYSNCPNPAVCCAVPVARMMEPVPGGRPTSVPESKVNLFGAHVSNQNVAGSYLQFFDTTTQPPAGSVPIGASSWVIPAGQDRDLDVGSGGGGAGWAFNQGIMACCSGTQGTFSAVGGCGFLLQYY